MVTKQVLEDELKKAMLESDEMKKRSIRLLLANIKMAEIDQGKPLESSDLISVIQKDIKIRHEAIDGAEKAGRQEIIDQNKAEITFLESFLPMQLTEEELSNIVQSAITESGAASSSDMGKVMKAILPKIKGQASNDAVSKMVKRLLNS